MFPRILAMFLVLVMMPILMEGQTGPGNQVRRITNRMPGHQALEIIRARDIRSNLENLVESEQEGDGIERAIEEITGLSLIVRLFQPVRIRDQDPPLEYRCRSCGNQAIRVSCTQTEAGIQLRIDGTSCNDSINVWGRSRHPHPPRLTAGGQAREAVSRAGASDRGFYCTSLGHLIVYGRDACTAANGRSPDELVIFGNDGNDRIDLNSGFEGEVPGTVYGGAGHDQIRGGIHDDSLYGGPGNDIIDGGNGDDTIHGDGGNDHLWGGSGDDFISGNGGSDHIDGGSGLDTLLGGNGNDHLITGDEHFDGCTVEEIQTSFQDMAIGGDGNDCIWGDFSCSGRDLCFGSDDDDRIRCHFFMSGGNGDDILIAPDWYYNYMPGELLRWSGVIVWGDGGDDELTGASGHDELHGGAGDDCMQGFLGRNLMEGGSGEDICLYRNSHGAGSDTCPNVEEELDAYEVNSLPASCRRFRNYPLDSWCERPSAVIW